MTGTKDSTCRLAVVIVSWNTRELLRSCLYSLVASTGIEDQIFVVDNASGDGSAEMVEREFPSATLVRNRCNLGFARAVNQAVRQSSARFVLLLNSDAAVRREAIDETVRYLEDHPRVAIASCRITHPDGTFQSSCFRFPSLVTVALNAVWIPSLFPRSSILNWPRYGNGDRRWTQPTVVDCVMGGFFAFRASEVQRDRCLDEDYFMYGEEVHLCHGVKARGQQVVFLPLDGVQHVAGGSTKSHDVSAWAYGAKMRAILRFMRKSQGRSAAWLANLVLLAGFVPRSAAWIAIDALTWRPKRGPFFRRSLRCRAVVWHVRAVTQPSAWRESWGPPPAPSLPDEATEEPAPVQCERDRQAGRTSDPLAERAVREPSRN